MKKLLSLLATLVACSSFAATETPISALPAVVIPGTSDLIVIYTNSGAGYRAARITIPNLAAALTNGLVGSNVIINMGGFGTNVTLLGVIQIGGSLQTTQGIPFATLTNLFQPSADINLGGHSITGNIARFNAIQVNGPITHYDNTGTNQTAALTDYGVFGLHFYGPGSNQFDRAGASMSATQGLGSAAFVSTASFDPPGSAASVSSRLPEQISALSSWMETRWMMTNFGGLGNTNLRLHIGNAYILTNAVAVAMGMWTNRDISGSIPNLGTIELWKGTEWDNLTHYGTILGPSNGTFASGYVGGPCIRYVITDDGPIWNMTFFGGTNKCFEAENHGPDGHGSLDMSAGEAFSLDGIHWTLSQTNPIYKYTDGTNWDGGKIYMVDTIPFKYNNQYWRFYMAAPTNSGDTAALGLMTSPTWHTNGTTVWTAYSNNPVIPNLVGRVTIFQLNDGRFICSGGAPFSSTTDGWGWYISSDLYHWQGPYRVQHFSLHTVQSGFQPFIFQDDGLAAFSDDDDNSGFVLSRPTTTLNEPLNAQRFQLAGQNGGGALMVGQTNVIFANFLNAPYASVNFYWWLHSHYTMTWSGTCYTNGLVDQPAGWEKYLVLTNDGNLWRVQGTNNGAIYASSPDLFSRNWTNSSGNPWFQTVPARLAVPSYNVDFLMPTNNTPANTNDPTFLTITNNGVVYQLKAYK